MGIVEAFFWMMMNTHHESRGEELVGKVAVNYVVLNRAKQGKKTVKQVVTAYRQFSWTLDQKKIAQAYFLEKEFKIGVSTLNLKRLKRFSKYTESIKAVLTAFITQDPTEGCNHYYNPSKASPKWGNSGYKVTIGRHDFHELNYGYFRAPREKKDNISYAVIQFSKCVKYRGYDSCEMK
jgi:spore germination cell wall hydrolase CwlJ-like protein